MSQTELALGRKILDRMADDDGLRVLRRELAALYRRRLEADRLRDEKWGGGKWEGIGSPKNAAVTADDARRIMSRLGMTFANNNRLGALFQSAEWAWTGDRIRSETKGSHGNELKTWRLK